FAKPVRDTWLELQGYPSLSLSIGAPEKPQSVMVTRTFTPPSMDREYIFSQLSKNVEAACAKVRRAGLKASALSFYLKTQEFTYHGVQLDLLAAYDAPPEMLKTIHKHFDEVYAKGILYRTSGVTLRCLRWENAVTPDLFGAYDESQEKEGVFRAQDLVNRRYGRNTIYLGSSMQALVRPEASYRKKVSRGFVSASRDGKKSLDIPYLGTAH
ncbi:MAG: hypothetical protein Q8O19_03680, partial [Rectinemataceae bacterium]|nr:hypothetical protein [Rectinemataceae bacterium]